MNADNANEILQYIIKNNIIQMSDVQEAMIMDRQKQVLKRHPYKISKLKDGRVSTYVADETKKEKRRKIVKKNEEELLKELCQYYDSCTQKRIDSTSILDLYSEWLKYKENQSNRSSYIYRLDKDWMKFYFEEELSQDIIKIPVVQLKKIELENWAYSVCKKHKMTKKCYYNMSHIMRSILDYAEELELIKENPFRKVKIKTSFFRKTPKKKSETQVFTKDEERLLIKEAYKAYSEEEDNVLYLMVPMFFYSGMRLGELSALEWQDVHEDYLFVHQIYGREEERDENGNWKTSTFRIIDMLKQNAPFREVLITPDVTKVLRKIKAYYWKQGILNPKFVFLDKNRNHPHPSNVDHIFYRLCDRCNILRRSPHKSRKTYISTLIDGGLNLDFIREQVGHEDERTTLQNYCFNRATQDETKEKLVKVLM